MAHRRWKWLLVVALIPLLVWGYDRAALIYWVGGADLYVEFVITDSNAETVIPGVRVEVQSEGGSYEERDRQQFPVGGR